MRRAWRPLGLGIAVVIAIAVVSITLVSRGDEKRPYLFGTLQTDPAKARLEHDKGIDVAHLSIRWDLFEPAKGAYDAGYADSVRTKLRAFEKAGLLVEVGLGLNHPPGWLYERHPDAAFVNQHGVRSTVAPNLVFSQAVRAEAEAYIEHVAQVVGLANFWAVRVGVNDNGEFSYPSPVSGDDFWAYDDNAQSGTGRPSTVAATPFPGWRPGERTYRGERFTQDDVSRWYEWYHSALSDAVNWQIRMYRALGYQGLLKVLVPGGGFYPADLRAAIEAYLGGAETDRLIGRGVGFFKTIEQVRPRERVQIVSTALVDGTGKPANNRCAPTDTGVDILASGAVRDWSSTRWVANIARRAGFEVSGESAGPQVADYYPGVIDTALQQMMSCGLRDMMWAFDGHLYDGTPGSSLQEYGDAIARATNP
jgi:hypothetical protein